MEGKNNLAVSKREHWVDYAKGIAALATILGHAIQYVYYNNVDFAYNPVFLWIYSFHMPLFCFASGYLLVSFCRKYAVSKQLARKCLLFFPILTWGMLVFFLNERPLTFGGLFRSIYYNNWFLWTILYCSLFSVLLVLIDKKLWCAGLILWVFSLLIPDAGSLLGFKMMFPSFLFGYAWGVYNIPKRLQKAKFAPLVCFLTFSTAHLLCFALFGSPTGIMLWEGYLPADFGRLAPLLLQKTLLGLLGSGAFASFALLLESAKRLPLVGAILSFSGRNALASYLLQYPLFVACYPLILHAWNLPLKNLWLTGLSSVIVFGMFVLTALILNHSAVLSLLWLGRKMPNQIFKRRNAMGKRKKIMLIPQETLPIPAIKGGAVETLVTALLDENEREKLAKFVCTSIYDEDAANRSYRHAKIYYFDKAGKLITNGNWVHRAWKCYQLWIKLFHNRITAKLFGARQVIEEFKIYQYYWIARKNKVNAIVTEGREDDRFLAPLNCIVGVDNFYNHIHFERKENLQARKLIPNSISISEYIKNQWVIDNSLPGKNEVLFNGIDTDRFQKGLSGEKRHEMRSELGISDSEILVFFCARIYPGKGVKELLDCFDLLKGKPIKLLLIGDAPNDNAQNLDYSNSVLSRAKEMDNVIPMGYVDYKKIHEYYAISDLATVPSIHPEGAGLVAIEGMASGLPLIITRSGGMPEYVTNETAMILDISEHLASDLASAILDLAENKEKRAQMGAAGKKHAAQFSNTAFYHHFLELIKG